MSKKLKEEEIRKRLIEWRNLKQLHKNQKIAIKKLKNENKELKKEVEELKNMVIELRQTNEKQWLELEELRKMIFRKEKKNSSIENKKKRNTKSKNRPKSSYRKSAPSEDEVTDRTTYNIEECEKCGRRLTRKKKAIRYNEDMILPIWEENKNNKILEKQIIYKWFCNNCKRWRAGKKHSPHRTTYGKNIKMFIVYCIVVLRLWYHQTRDIIKDLSWINISDWEIAKILRKQAKELRWYYEEIKENIKKQKWAHFDETTWKVVKKWGWDSWNYCWIMKGTETSEVVYLLWKNRWKGNMKKLLKRGEKEQVWISDDYGVYRNIFKHHQLCWAHPNRKLRDLTESNKLNKKKNKLCVVTYKKFNKLYKKLNKILEEDFDIEKRKEQQKELKKEFEEVTKIDENEPEKLKKIKASLKKNKEKYFTCMLHKWIPADNNAAERWLRHVVLKRKNSFWSKTSTWAEVMSVLLSVMMTLWNDDKDNFFKKYSSLLEKNS